MRISAQVYDELRQGPENIQPDPTGDSKIIMLKTTVLPAVMMETETHMSDTTHFMHLLVTDVSNLFMYVMELLSAIILIVTTVVAFYKLFNHKPYARVYLLHGQSVGLSFKLGAEILKTITAQSMTEIWQILLLILIKAAMMLLIEWELHGIEDPYNEEGYITTKKDREDIKHSIFYNPHHKKEASQATEELTAIRQELDELIQMSQKKDNPDGKANSGEPIL